MNVIVDFSLVPIGVGTSLSKYVAKCEQVLREAGLRINLHGYGTNIEGEWDEVMQAIKKCHTVVHDMGAPRISTIVKIGTRIDRKQTIQDKILSVEKKAGPSL
ncbi:MTH1187 family thiamine-binding protein [candidate division CSSED10-310 bacterium]|uniref:MTH1187 family thiamine-binding protein n=1 Tax=candidate division CSSED10-310 bacterium TaxID=2855610 RepID=A0ABV6YWA2_UNCC1